MLLYLALTLDKQMLTTKHIQSSFVSFKKVLNLFYALYTVHVQYTVCLHIFAQTLIIWKHSCHRKETSEPLFFTPKSFHCLTLCSDGDYFVRFNIQLMLLELLN